MAYIYKKYEYDEDDYGSNFGKNYGYKYEDNYEWSYLDGYTTSAFSYDESKKRQRLTSRQSRSEYGQRRHDASVSHRPRSPKENYDGYFKQDDSIKKKLNETKNDVKNVFYQFEIEKFKRKERKSQSSRRKDECGDIFDVPEDDNDYETIFDQSKPKEKRQKRYKNEIMSGDDRNISEKQKIHLKKYKDSQTFAYQEPKLHEKVFRSREKIHSRSHSSSEIEIKTIDYPILAFKENNTSKNTSKTSSVLYLPTVYCHDKKSKSQGKTKPRTQTCKLIEKQVFATNVIKNNIIAKENEKHNKNSTNKAVSKLKNDESQISRDTKSKHDSNPKISTETQTEESLILDRKLINNLSYKNTGSIIENTELKYKPLSETKETKKYESRKKRNDLFAYQIDNDVEPKNKNLFQSKIIPSKKNVFESKITSANELRQIEYKHLDDPIQDNYPVTKDYIKVIDNSSLQITPNIISSISYMSDKSSRKFKNKKSTIGNKRSIISGSMECKGTKMESRGTMINVIPNDIISRVNEIIIKDIPENRFRRNYECSSFNKNSNKGILRAVDFELDDGHDYREKQNESQKPYVFRSKVDNHFEYDDKACNKEKIIKSQNNQIPRLTAVESEFKNDDVPDHREKRITPHNNQMPRLTAVESEFKNDDVPDHREKIIKTQNNEMRRLTAVDSEFKNDDEPDHKEFRIKPQNTHVFRSKVDNRFENYDKPCNKGKIISPQNIQISRLTEGDSGFKNDDEHGHRENIINPQNTHVFRSTLDNEFKNLMTRRSIIASQLELRLKQNSHTGANESNISFDRPKYSEQPEDGQDKTEFKKANGDQEVEDEFSTQLEKTVVIKQRGVPSGGDQKGNVQEYRVESSNSGYPLTVKKSKSITRESRWGRPNEESVVTDSKSHVGAKESRSEHITVFPVIERKSQLILRESKLDKLNNVSTLIDGKSQISNKQSKSEILSQISHYPGEKKQSITRKCRIERPSNANYRTKDLKENQAKNTKVIKTSRFLSTVEQKKPKTPLRSFYSKKKPIPNEKSENHAVTENLESKRDETLLKNSQENILQESETILPKKSTRKNIIPKTVISELFFRGKTLPKTEASIQTSTENVMQSFSKKASEFENDFNKSMMFPSQKSKEIFVKNSVSILSARSKHKLQKLVGISSKNKSLSKNKLTSIEQSVASISHGLAPSQKTLKRKQSKQKKISKPKLLKCKSHENITLKESRNKSKSKIREFISTSKSKIEAELSTKEIELTPPSESSVKASKEVAMKSEKTESINDNETKGEKSCECITHYVKQAKECGDFFLGTTLHQQVMDLLKVI